MDIKLISTSKDKYPYCGLFVQDKSLNVWLNIMQNYGLNSDNTEIYVLPSNSPNSVWGCLLYTKMLINAREIGPYLIAQEKQNLIIPEKSDLFPKLNKEDLKTLLGESKYIMHPEVGLFKLTKPLNIQEYIRFISIEQLETVKPQLPIVHNHMIHSVKIIGSTPEELSKELSENTSREKLEQKPLTIREKIRLQLYNQIFTVKKDKKDNPTVKIKPGVKNIYSALRKFSDIKGNLTENKMKQDYLDLYEKNKKEVDKLMDMLKKNPSEALKYAIPLDEHHSTRGKSEKTKFELYSRRNFLSLFGNEPYSRSDRSRSVDLGDEFFTLKKQYLQTAKDLIASGEHEKAAFIYIKLLKNYKKAAETLEEGKFYEKAAYTYLKYQKNEFKAAECYEKGKLWDKAIELYKKNGKLEKVADLYVIQGKKSMAIPIYNQIIEQHVSRLSYLEGSVIATLKLEDIEKAQSLLFEGWEKGNKRVQCLTTYLKNIEEDKIAWQKLQKIHSSSKKSASIELKLLKVTQQEFTYRIDTKEQIRNLGYCLISSLLESKMINSKELLAFNPFDSRLLADTIRFNIKNVERYNR